MVRSRWRWRRPFSSRRRRRRSCVFGRRWTTFGGRRTTFGRRRRAGQHGTVSQAEGECESSECRNHLEIISVVRRDDDERESIKKPPWNQAIYIAHNLPAMEVSLLSLGSRIRFNNTRLRIHLSSS
jgi:hypothetical protein